MCSIKHAFHINSYLFAPVSCLFMPLVHSKKLCTCSAQTVAACCHGANRAHLPPSIMARRLDEILKTDPNTRCVRLEYESLEDLTPLLPVLGVLPSLTELDLRGNKLATLPRDLSSLRNVTTLHLQQNLFRCVVVFLLGRCAMGRTVSRVVGCAARLRTSLVRSPPCPPS